MEEVLVLQGFVWLIGLLIYFAIQYVIARKFEKIAEEKGYDSDIHSFAMCFWLGFVGYLYVIALPNLVQKKNQEKLISLLESKPSREEVRNDISYGEKMEIPKQNNTVKEKAEEKNLGTDADNEPKRIINPVDLLNKSNKDPIDL